MKLLNVFLILVIFAVYSLSDTNATKDSCGFHKEAHIRMVLMGKQYLQDNEIEIAEQYYRNADIAIEMWREQRCFEHGDDLVSTGV